MEKAVRGDGLVAAEMAVPGDQVVTVDDIVGAGRRGLLVPEVLMGGAEYRASPAMRGA